MTIVELLKSDDSVRLTWEDQWMIYYNDEWIVYSRERYSSPLASEIYRGTDEAAAVAALKSGEG